MKRFKERMKKLDNRGLSLVELICAMAILSIIGTIVGGILVVSAKSYDTGINEAELQQEAQMVVNQINDLVIDTTATESVTFDGTTLTIPEGTKTHYVKYDASAKKLYYSCDGGEIAGDQLMATGITAFNADTSTFKDSGNLYLDIGLERMSNGTTRDFNATFQITSRNGVVDTTPAASIDVIDDVLLEPNQSYEFHPQVVGISNTAVTWEIVGGNTDANTHMVGNTIYIGSSEAGSIVHLLVKTATKDADGNPMAMRAVRVRIRRINSVNVNIISWDGEAYKADTEYTVEATLIGTYLDQEPWDFDLDYVSPYGVTWAATPTGGATAPTITSITWDPLNPTKAVIKLKLTADMPRNSKITIRATANHPKGKMGATQTNKTGISYGNIYGEKAIDNSSFIEVTHGMGRGSDDEWAHFYVDDLKALLRELYGRDDFTFTRKYRFRVSGSGDSGWSRWFDGSELGSDDPGSYSINVRPNFGYQMYYGKSYDAQCEIKVIDSATGQVMWPLADTSQDQYLLNGTLNRVKVSFTSTALSFSEEFELDASRGAKVDKNFGGTLFTVKDLYSLGGSTNKGNFYNDLHYILEKKVGGTWQKVEDLQSGPNCNVQIRGNAGEYRVCVWMDEIHITANDDGSFSHNGKSEKYEIFNVGGGEGIFYFTAQ